LIIVFIGVCKVKAIQFFLKQGEERCISEEASAGDVIQVEYSSSPDNSLISLSITAPDHSIRDNKILVNKGKFAETSTSNGDYRVCLANNDPNSNEMKTIELKVKVGIDAKDYSGVALKGSLKPMEIELKRLEDGVAAIKKDYLAAKEREELHKATNDSTSSRVLGFSFFNIFLLITIIVSQLLYLKRYFQKKKLIQ